MTRVFNGSLQELSLNDIIALLYTSILGSTVSYGVYFYSATKGCLTKLSSFTFLSPMFASIFGYIYLDDTFSSLQVATGRSSRNFSRFILGQLSRIRYNCK
ncbi:EamA domain-containing protein [Hirschfeldia incana]|nr:EamA domain-containing protein [Hirschfeldia incana]KAJ0235006.1 EamA domain-containing protein [Hirschfeldia incana]